MKVPFFTRAAGTLLVAASILMAQQPQQQTGQQSQQAGPKPKSQKEVEALQKVKEAIQAHNPDAEIQAVNDVLMNFADTDYKPILLNIAMQASAQKGDYAQTIVWGDRIIQNDPNDVQARALLAEYVAQHTRENDLDKEQSLKKVDDYANKVLELLKTSNTPPTGIPPDKWTDYKNQLSGQAYDALGLAASARKKYPEAVGNFKNAINADPSPLSTAHLAKAYVDNKQYDDAIATADKVLAMNEVPPSVKQYAEQQKAAASKLKGGGAGGAAAKPN